jgi:hypothetical protein
MIAGSGRQNAKVRMRKSKCGSQNAVLPIEDLALLISDYFDTGQPTELSLCILPCDFCILALEIGLLEG